jgi:23S rRNA pseudouridine1911/1915/1917 synthase
MSRETSLSVPSGGERLDRFLAAARTDLSRSGLQALIKGGHVLVNGRTAKASLRLKSGDQVRITLPEPRTLSLIPEAIPLRIVFQDPDLVVVDKPAGLVVHPGAGVPRGTLVHALLHAFPEVAAVGGAGRPGIVHRLDKDTSGLLLVARSPRAYLALIEAMRRREIHRVYHALVWGSPRAASGIIETAIGRDPRERKRMAVVRRGGKPARTHWHVRERFGHAAWLEVHLDTGRTHQIRVHLAHLGYPVIGDPVYGGRVKKGLSPREPERSLRDAVLAGLPRQALHASELELTHPIIGRPLAFVSPWPDDFSRAVDLLRDPGARRA